MESICFISVAPKDQKKTHQPSQTVPIVGAVCGVVAVAVICATVYLVIRYRTTEAHAKWRSARGHLNSKHK